MKWYIHLYKIKKKEKIKKLAKIFWKINALYRRQNWLNPLISVIPFAFSILFLFFSSFYKIYYTNKFSPNYLWFFELVKFILYGKCRYTRRTIIHKTESHLGVWYVVDAPNADIINYQCENTFYIFLNDVQRRVDFLNGSYTGCAAIKITYTVTHFLKFCPPPSAVRIEITF